MIKVNLFRTNTKKDSIQGNPKLPQEPPIQPPNNRNLVVGSPEQPRGGSNLLLQNGIRRKNPI